MDSGIIVNPVVVLWQRTMSLDGKNNVWMKILQQIKNVPSVDRLNRLIIFVKTLVGLTDTMFGVKNVVPQETRNTEKHIEKRTTK